MKLALPGPAKVIIGFAKPSSAFTWVLLLLFTASSWGCVPGPGPAAETAGELHSTSPSRVDVDQRYMFYLHGRIIEEQGIAAVSAEYGAYEYEKILERLRSSGFIVISEPRPRNTEVVDYAELTVSRIESLLDAGAPPENITVVGASKGAYIAALTSHLARNRDLNFVLLATCHPEMVEHMRSNQMGLWGNILAIRDRDDELAGSCEEVFAFSEGIGRTEERVLEVGTGHGILYRPLDEWVIPTIEWAGSAHD